MVVLLNVRKILEAVIDSGVATDPTRVREIFNALKEHKLLQISEKTKGVKSGLTSPQDSGEVDSDDYDNSDSDIPPESSSEEIGTLSVFAVPFAQQPLTP